MTELHSATAYSDAQLSTEAAQANSVRILPADIEFGVVPGETVVDAIRRHGYRTRYSCRRGGCGACKAELVGGAIDYATPVAESVLSATEIAAGKCLPCRAEPLGPVVIRLAANDRLRHVFGSFHPASNRTGR